MQKFHLVDYYDNPIRENYEIQEQLDIKNYLCSDAKVLEIGGRFGVVSCVINSILKNKIYHIVVEPDEIVWKALQKNKVSTNSEFHIIQGAMSYKPVMLCSRAGLIGAASIFSICDNNNNENKIPYYTYDEITKNFGFVPDTLVIDCEGAFVEIFRDFPEMFDNVKQVFIEFDARDERNNDFYRDFILKLGFREIKGGFHSVFEKSR